MTKNPWSEFRSDVLKSLKNTFDELDWPKEGLVDSLEEPPDPSFGDLATTICFELPEKLKDSPQNLAQKLSESIEPVGMIEKIEPEGGYVNFFVDMTELTSATINQIEDSLEEYGRFEADGDKIIVEHTSVNPTKPIGDSYGVAVFRLCHISLAPEICCSRKKNILSTVFFCYKSSSSLAQTQSHYKNQA